LQIAPEISRRVRSQMRALRTFMAARAADKIFKSAQNFNIFADELRAERFDFKKKAIKKLRILRSVYGGY